MPGGNRTLFLFSIHIYISAFLVFAFFLPAVASTTEDVSQKYKRIQGEIKKNEEKLNLMKKRESSVLGEMDAIQKSLSKLERELRAEKSKLQETTAQIEKAQLELSQTQVNMKRHRNRLKRKLKGMYRQGNAEDLIMLFGAADMSSFLRRWHYLEILAKSDKESLDNYRAELKKIQNEEEKLKGLYAKLSKEQEATLEAQRRLAEKKSEKQEILNSVRTEKATYAKLVEELKQASRELFSIIRRSEERDHYEGRGFRWLKGKLLWPVNGAIALQYGKQLDPQFKTPIFRNGIYLRTSPDAVARAVFEGKVVYANWFKGYGQLVIINHGDGYHTLYANLDEIFLKVGDIIEKRTEIGRVGESVLLNAPSLYFEVRYKGKPLDPMQWLGRK